MISLTDSDMTSAIVLSTALSEVSKATYVSNLKRLTKITGLSLYDIVYHEKPENIIGFIVAAGYKEPQTLRTFVKAVLALIKHNDLKYVIGEEQHSAWNKTFRNIDEVVAYKYDNMIPSHRQVQSYLPWRHIIDVRESMDKNSREYLLLSLYTMIPPLRADFDKIKIYYTSRKKLPSIDFPNYLLVSDDDNMVLFLNEFKSKSKSIPIYRNNLPAQLSRVISSSLKIHPREFLIVSPRTGKPFNGTQQYINYVNKTFRSIFDGKRVTINTLRHSFINSLNLNSMSLGDMREIARQMCHSIETMMSYRLNIR